MIAKVTQRTELGPSRGLPTARNAQVERVIRVNPPSWRGSPLHPTPCGTETFAQAALQVLLSDNDDVVEAVPPNGTDNALAVRILPGGLRRGFGSSRSSKA